MLQTSHTGNKNIKIINEFKTTKSIITIKSKYFIQNNTSSITTEQMQNSNTEKSQRMHNKTYKKYETYCSSQNIKYNTHTEKI